MTSTVVVIRGERHQPGVGARGARRTGTEDGATQTVQRRKWFAVVFRLFSA